MPASSIRARSSGPLLAVRATIAIRGTPAAASRRRISRAVAGPSSPGIIPSRNRTSNGSAASLASASRPPPTTVASTSWRPSRRPTTRRLSALSSATSTRGRRVGSISLTVPGGLGAVDPHTGMPVGSGGGRREGADPLARRRPNSARIDVDGDICDRWPARDPSPVRDRLAVGRATGCVDVDRRGLRPDQSRIEGGGDHQRVVDERPVEAVGRGVELEVEAERVGEEPDRRGCSPPTAARRAGARDQDAGEWSEGRPAPGERDHVVAGQAGLLGDVEAEPQRASRRRVCAHRRPPGRKGDPRHLRVAVHVPLADGRRVAGDPERAAHADPAPEEPGERGARSGRRSRGW